MSMRFETLAVHGGQHPDPATLSRGVPVYRTSSYVFKSAEHAANLFGLAEPGNVYGRLGNPTQAVLEERVSLLEGGVGAVAFASGTSAVFSAIVNLARQGDEIVSANNLYGGTFTLFNDILPQFGITTRFVKPNDLEGMEAAVTERTRAIYVEAIGNPSLDVTDLDAVSALAKRHGLPLVADATFVTPYLLRPFAASSWTAVRSTGPAGVFRSIPSRMRATTACVGDSTCRKAVRRTSPGCVWCPCATLDPASRPTTRG